MIKKEIKQFVITQMKEANWCIEKVDGFNEYKSKHINILHETDLSQRVTFIIKIPNSVYISDNLRLNRGELGINYFYYRYLLRIVKKSCSLVDKRKREQEISENWNKFLEKNKDLKRDNRLNQILDNETRTT
jgi:hypothetical protein